MQGWSKDQLAENRGQSLAKESKTYPQWPGPYASREYSGLDQMETWRTILVLYLGILIGILIGYLIWG